MLNNNININTNSVSWYDTTNESWFNVKYLLYFKWIYNRKYERDVD